MDSSAEDKLLTALMLLEMCERQNDPELLNKVIAAHQFAQSAFYDLRDGSDPVAVNSESMEYVAKIRADAAIADAQMVPWGGEPLEN